MKKIILILLAIVPAVGFSQIKPNLSKNEKLLREGKIKEAKEMIDATVASQEFMVDKKGGPSKNAAKAYFLKGVIYAAIDTTSKEEFKSLDPNAFETAKAAFEKQKEIDPKTPNFVTDASGYLPMMNETVFAYMAQGYFNKAIYQYQEKKDYKKAFQFTEQTLYFAPKDTSILMNAGVYFGPSAEEWDKSLALIQKYHDAGGHSRDSYIQEISIYLDKLKNNEKGLEAVKRAMAKFPADSDFPKYELDLYVKMEKLPEAKEAVTKQTKADPTNKESWYYLGLINSEMKDYEAARKAFEEAKRIDPKYFEAAFAIADIAYLDAKKVKAQMNQLGITAADKKKRLELDQTYVAELKKVVPLWEEAERLSPDDAKVLDVLLGIYQDLGDQPKITRISKHMKSLGLLDN